MESTFILNDEDGTWKECVSAPMDTNNADLRVHPAISPARVIGGARKPSPKLRSKWTTAKRLAIVQKYKN